MAIAKNGYKDTLQLYFCMGMLYGGGHTTEVLRHCKIHQFDWVWFIEMVPFIKVYPVREREQMIFEDVQNRQASRHFS